MCLEGIEVALNLLLLLLRIAVTGPVAHGV
jgi:hypothetical protein